MVAALDALHEQLAIADRRVNQAEARAELG